MLPEGMTVELVKCVEGSTFGRRPVHTTKAYCPRCGQVSAYASGDILHIVEHSYFDHDHMWMRGCPLSGRRYLIPQSA